MDVRCPSSFLQMRQCMLVLLVVFLWFIVQVLSAPLLCDRAILFQGPAKANITFEFESVTQFSVPTSKQVYNTRKFSWKNAIYGVSKSPQPLFWTFLLRFFFLVWSDLFVFDFFLFSCLIFTSRVFLFPYFSDLLYCLNFSFFLVWSFLFWSFPFFCSTSSRRKRKDLKSQDQAGACGRDIWWLWGATLHGRGSIWCLARNAFWEIAGAGNVASVNTKCVSEAGKVSSEDGRVADWQSDHCEKARGPSMQSSGLHSGGPWNAVKVSCFWLHFLLCFAFQVWVCAL